MGLKDINYKQILFDQGERVGLAVAGFIAFCLVLSLFWPGSGFLSPSAGANAESLDSLAKKVDDGIQGPRATQPGPEDKPGDPTDKLVAFNFDIISDARAKDYMVAGVFDGRAAGSTAGRQMPELKQPRESRVALVRFQLPSLVFDKQFESLWTLVGAPASGAGAPTGSSSMAPNGAMLGKMYGSMAPKSGGLNTPAITLGNQKDTAKRNLVRGQGDEGDKEDKDFKTAWVKLDKLAADMKLAEQAYPQRVAEIVAAFPYKEQVREFRDKLHLASEAAVLTELSLETKDGKPLNAFRFLGVTVQRRQVGGQDKPLGDKEGWTTLDLDSGYKPLIVLNGKRLEEEDVKLRPVVFPGLVMKKLVTFGERRKPPIDEYPKIEDELPSLKATTDALFKTPDVKVGRPSLTQIEGSIFDLDAPTGAPTGPGSMGPGSSPPPGVMPPGLSSPMPNSTTPDGTKSGQDLAIPDACLIRLFDVTIEAGKTYEYRIQVRMANPNYHRKDSASQGYAEDPELRSNNWYVLPEKLTVPADLYYYALDQKDIDAKEPPKEGRDPKEPKLPIQPVKEGLQTVLQIQKWVDYLPKSKGVGAEIPIGDWVVAERVVATRGEPLSKQQQRAEVPYWRTTQDRFTLASDPSNPKAKGPPTVEVPFAKDGEEPILVDFSGGDVSYKRSHPKTEDGAPAADQPLPVQDKAPSEVVLLMGDGRLVAHNSAQDAADPARIKRLEEARDWIQNVKKFKGGMGNNDTPFP
jgi:hypothetical protein